MAAVTDKKAESPDLAEYRSLPEESQLLLAYCLLQDNPEFSLLPFDHDVDALLAKAWAQKTGPVRHGLQRYTISDSKWDLLIKLDSQILTHQMGERLERYRLRKRALYPWCW